MERITFFFIISLSLSSSVQADHLGCSAWNTNDVLCQTVHALLYRMLFSAKVSVKRVTRFGVQQKEEFYPTKRTVHCTIQEQHLMTSIKFFFFFLIGSFVTVARPPLTTFFSPLNRMGCRQTNKKKRREQDACLTCIVDLMSCSQDTV